MLFFLLVHSHGNDPKYIQVTEPMQLSWKPFNTIKSIMFMFFQCRLQFAHCIPPPALSKFQQHFVKNKPTNIGKNKEKKNYI
jgi:hypothetical protein